MSRVISLCVNIYLEKYFKLKSNIYIDLNAGPTGHFRNSSSFPFSDSDTCTEIDFAGHSQVHNEMKCYPQSNIRIQVSAMDCNQDTNPLLEASEDDKLNDCQVGMDGNALVHAYLWYRMDRYFPFRVSNLRHSRLPRILFGEENKEDHQDDSLALYKSPWFIFEVVFEIRILPYCRFVEDVSGSAAIENLRSRREKSPPNEKTFPSIYASCYCRIRTEVIP